MKEDTYKSAQFSQKPILRLPCSVQFKICFLSGSVQFLTPIVCSITPINLPFFASAEEKLRREGLWHSSPKRCTSIDSLI